MLPRHGHALTRKIRAIVVAASSYSLAIGSEVWPSLIRWPRLGEDSRRPASSECANPSYDLWPARLTAYHTSLSRITWLGTIVAVAGSAKSRLIFFCSLSDG